MNEIGGVTFPTSPAKGDGCPFRPLLSFSIVYVLWPHYTKDIVYLSSFFNVPLDMKFFTRFGFKMYKERA